ncbi:uncharacterized protein N7503_009164 [Penicillium pulvis]|uniref:uncharacterized protein n=1 Tax=Penicillium pulvis TaxID=1562058 RepID=UPI0025466EC8|nr:uncharacterized protein N7503_009164 [Penicillium pulvis]KAJ5793186.1 hypothetical protein N7503_009164 [Penicillium pulvis]
MAYFEAQTLLTTWTDELEYLGYILCELIDTHSLDTTGYRYHQAADLPTFIDIIRIQVEEPDGSLVNLMSEDELKTFRGLMSKAKRIRNNMAHHMTQNEDRLNDLGNTKQAFSDMLEYAIRSVASDREIDQVAWCPYHHICKAYIEANKPPTVMIPLNGDPLLSIREKILRDHDSQQMRLLYKRPKRKATEEGRQKQKDDHEAALIRKQQRKERDIALRSSHVAEKCRRLEQRFKELQELNRAQMKDIKMRVREEEQRVKESQELGRAQIINIETRMREEQKMFNWQRAEILKDGVLHSSPDPKPLLIAIFVTISSPFWIVGLVMYNLYNRGPDHSSDA